MTGLPFWEMPDRLTVGGISYPIDSDFRVGIRIRQMFWEPYYRKHPQFLIDGIRQLLFWNADIGEDWEAVIGAVLWYLMDGRMSEARILHRLRGDGGHASADALGGESVFSYLWDMPAVYADRLVFKLGKRTYIEEQLKKLGI